MNHSFDIEHAQRYGLHEAILIANFQFWIVKNEANGRHLHEGRTWTYNSAKALSVLLPYMTDRQVRRSLDSLVEQGVLLKGNFNASTYDRTLWFAFDDESTFLSWQIHSPNTANGNDKSGDSLTDINTAVKPDTSSRKRAMQCPPDVPQELWDDFLNLRTQKRAAVTNTAIAGLRREGEKAGMKLEQVLFACCTNGWQGFKAEWMQPRGNGGALVVPKPGGGMMNKQEALEAENNQVGRQWAESMRGRNA